MSTGFIRTEPRQELFHPDKAPVQIDVDHEFAGREYLRGRALHPPLRHHDEGRSQGWVTGEGKLGCRSEDAHRVTIAPGLRDEGRLRESDLSGDCLHQPGGKIDRIWHDTELVSGERSVGEYVDQPKRDAHVDMLLH